MLKLNNIKRLFKARGIENPYRYLLNHGFTAGQATRILKGNISRVDLRLIEEFCLMLECTPHDLLEWIPDKSMAGNTTHPLNALRRTGSEIDLMQTLSRIPVSMLGEIEELIAAKVRKK